MLNDTLGAGVFEVVCVALVLTDTLGAGVFEVVCDIVDVNDCDELLDKVIELLTDGVGSAVLLIDSDTDTVAD